MKLNKNINKMLLFKMNNKGFFLPTIMMFVLLFTLLLLFGVYNNLNYGYLVSSFEKEVYYEVALLEAKTYIKNYLNYDKEYSDICEQNSYKNKKDKYEINVIPMCFIENKTLSLKILNKSIVNKNNDLQISEKEYREYIDDINKMKTIEVKGFKKLKKQIKKELKKTSMSDPEIKVIIGKAKQEVDRITNQYIAFDIEIKIEEQKNLFHILYIYNFENNKKDIIKYI